VNKRIKSWLIGIVIVLFVAISFELLFNWLFSVKEETIKRPIAINNNGDNNLEEIKVETTDVLEEFIISVMNDIKNGQYDKVYDVVDKDYREYRFNSPSDIKDFFNGLVKEDTNIEVISYEKKDSNYVCFVRFNTGDTYEVKQFILKEKYAGNYSILFEDILSINKKTAIVKGIDNGIQVQLLYELIYSTNKTFVVKIINNSGNSYIIPKDKISVTYSTINKDKESFPLNVSENIVIPANSDKTIPISFIYNKGEIRSSEIFTISIKTDINSNNAFPVIFSIGK
jgi:hypothetical protein